MIVGLAVAFPLLDSAVSGSDIGFHPEDGTDACFPCFLLKFPRPVQVAMIGDCERGLFELLGAQNQVIYSVRTVKKRVFGVAMEVDEGHTIRIRRARQIGQGRPRTRPAQVAGI